MKHVKRALAIFLAVLLMVPALPSVAQTTEGKSLPVEASVAVDQGTSDMSLENSTEVNSTQDEVPDPLQESTEEMEETVSGTGDVSETGSVEDTGTETETETETETGTETEAETETETSAMNEVLEPSEEIQVNTGNYNFSIVGQEDFRERGLGDDCFEEDGSYTINIPEDNPFFPYEVQFTYQGKVSRQWFMTPDDSIEIGGHVFYVSAYFDGTVVTQMNLNVAGKVITVYPEEKEFTEGDGISLLSLQPLEERKLSVDLSGFTPLELTMVSVDSIFTGKEQLSETDKVVWKYAGDDSDKYKIRSSGADLDLAYYTSNNYTSNSTVKWEMIVGEADQLAASNIRYQVQLNVTKSDDWLDVELYGQDEQGNRTEITDKESHYQDRYENTHTAPDDWAERRFYISRHSEFASEDTYAGIAINRDQFNKTSIQTVNIYEGEYRSAEAAAASGQDVTEQLMAKDMTQQDAGYPGLKSGYFTMVARNDAGEVIGCLPVYISSYLDYEDNEAARFSYSVQKKTGNNTLYVYYRQEKQKTDKGEIVTLYLYKEYAPEDAYYLTANYYEGNKWKNITSAFVGTYDSIAAAQAAGAEDVTGVLNSGGYLANYSGGVDFTLFVGADGTEEQVVHQCKIKTAVGDSYHNPSLGSGASAYFYGLINKDGQSVPCYLVEEKEDSYAEYNYLTILVGADTDLTALAPTFTLLDSKEHLYTSGSSIPENSGKNYHDFSQGPVHYTASSEDGANARNYWLHVVKAEKGAGQLYVNSLSDSNAETKVENGVTYSTRSIMLDSYHDDIHDILLVNKGTEDLPNLSVELVSDTVELDQYWTLSGNYELSGFSTVEKTTDNGELANLAKIRLKAKNNSDSGNGSLAQGAEITGTLKVKSGNKELMVLNLTGTVGDPVIVTDSIPQAVKYVPYGTMLQNNNKYSWNKVVYELGGGELPDGMELRPNGEIYGVPKSTGEFRFWVRMNNSDFSDCTKAFTLTVLENTDPNVDAATDQGYDLTQRIQNINFDATESQTVVSEGVYDEFVDVYLDGVKLEKDVDYTSEAGSTRITIRSQTLKAGNVAGTHTLGIEFRTKDEDVLKRAAQNYRVGDGSGNGGSDGGSDGGSTGDGNSGGHSGGSDSDDNSVGGNSQNTLVTSQSIAGTAGAVSGTAGAVSGQETVGETGNLTDGTQPVMVRYTVQKGDTLWKIAERFYGSGIYWQQIYQDNVNALPNPNKIYAGQELLIRSTTFITAGTTDNSNVTYYTVQKGDTLWKIAKKFYGKRRKWRKIYEANSVITDPNLIYSGQVIIIPDI